MELIVENFIFHEILGKLNSKESGIWSFIEIHKKNVIFHFSVHGNWTDYERWTACKKGQMTGYRFCTNPEPQNGGQDCIGSNKIIENCTTDESPGKSKIT